MSHDQSGMEHLQHLIILLSLLPLAMQVEHVLIVISGEIITRLQRIAILVTSLIIIMPPIRIIKLWLLQRLVRSATLLIRDGNLHHTLSMIVNSSLSIQEDTRENGRLAANAIQHLITILYLTVLTVIEMHTAGIIIPTRNVIVVTPGELRIRTLMRHIIFILYYCY